MQDDILETSSPEDVQIDISVSDDIQQDFPVDSSENVEMVGGDSVETSTEVPQTVTQDSKDYEPIITDNATAVIEAVTLVGSDIQATVYDSSSAIVNTMLFCSFLIVGMLTALKVFGGRV